jgi:uncharacterized protein DUF6285
MHNLPESSDLLLVARKTLLDEIRPMLDESAKYTVAMIANAMAIAARELEAGETPALAALARLNRIYGVEPRELHGQALRQALVDQESQLADDIRFGHFDAPAEKRRALLDHLRKMVVARLQVSNPKSLP